MDVITNGMVTVYAEVNMSVNDDVHVRIAVDDSDASPCQMIGGVTNTPDSGTQPAGSNVRIDMGCNAGEAVLLELGGMSPS
jgi:hypothetical protein